MEQTAPLEAVAAEGHRRTSVGAGYRPLLVGLLLIAVIYVTGILIPQSEHLASLMVVPPTATAALTNARRTSVVAIVSCAASFSLDLYDGSYHTSIPAIHLLSIILVSGFVIGFRTLRERDLAELVQVRSVSETAQRVLLRPLPTRLGPLRVGCAYHASNPHALVGGDVYATTRTTGGVRLLIGDVKGKGIPALDDAAALLGTFRDPTHRRESLPRFMASLEAVLRDHFQEESVHDEDAAERFVTALVLEIPYDGATVHMVNCGHPAPYLISPNGVTLLPPRTPSPPLGLNSLRPEDYDVESFEPAPEDTLLLYTDGAIEARDAEGRFHDLDAQLAAWTISDDPQELADYVLDGLLEYVGGQLRLDDDVALVALRREGDRSDAEGAAEAHRGP